VRLGELLFPNCTGQTGPARRTSTSGESARWRRSCRPETPSFGNNDHKTDGETAEPSRATPTSSPHHQSWGSTLRNCVVFGFTIVASMTDHARTHNPFTYTHPTFGGGTTVNIRAYSSFCGVGPPSTAQPHSEPNIWKQQRHSGGTPPGGNSLDFGCCKSTIRHVMLSALPRPRASLINRLAAACGTQTATALYDRHTNTLKRSTRTHTSGSPTEHTYWATS
jgi:hypothetical protein